MKRLLLALLWGAIAAVGGLGTWFLADSMFMADRVVLTGRIAEVGEEYRSGGRGGAWHVLWTMEGQPYVFTRRVGWLDGREDMLAAVRVGTEAEVTVLAEDLADEAARAPDDRRVPAWALRQDGETTFAQWAKALPMVPFLVIAALFTLVGALAAVGSLTPRAADAAERTK